MDHTVRKSVFLGLFLLCAGCAEITAQSVDHSQHKITEVCVQISKQTAPYDFRYILKEGFLRHGIKAKEYTDLPPDCEYRLTYLITIHENHSPVSLRDVHLALYQGSALIAYADRDSPKGFLGKEVTDLSQWDSTRSVLEPLVDGLLEKYQTESSK